MTVSNRKVHGDVGSEKIALMLEQLNRLTAAVQAIADAAVTNGDTFQTNVAALTELDSFEDIQDTVVLPARRRVPLS